MRGRQPRSPLTDPLFPYTTPVRSRFLFARRDRRPPVVVWCGAVRCSHQVMMEMCPHLLQGLAGNQAFAPAGGAFGQARRPVAAGLFVDDVLDIAERVDHMLLALVAQVVALQDRKSVVEGKSG